MDIREWCVVRLTLDDEIFTLVKSDFTLSEVCYGSLEIMNFNFFLLTALNWCVLELTSDWQLFMLNLDSTLVMRDTAPSQTMNREGVKRLRSEKSVTIHSKDKNWWCTI